MVGFSSGTISQVIEQGTIWGVNHETGVADKPALIDHVALPIFRGLLKLINLVEGFSPIDSLSTGPKHHLGGTEPRLFPDLRAPGRSGGRHRDHHLHAARTGHGPGNMS